MFEDAKYPLKVVDAEGRTIYQEYENGDYTKADYTIENNDIFVRMVQKQNGNSE